MEWCRSRGVTDLNDMFKRSHCLMESGLSGATSEGSSWISGYFGGLLDWLMDWMWEWEIGGGWWEKEKDVADWKEEHDLGEEIWWFVCNLLNWRCLWDIQGGHWIFTASEEERADLEMQIWEASSLTPCTEGVCIGKEEKVVQNRALKHCNI